MIRKLLYTLVGVLLLFTSCDDIAEEDRLIYVPPVKATRSVLVEEFSGQLCVNCPAGASVLEGLQEQFGADTVIVVSFHVDRSVNTGIPADWNNLTTTEGSSLFDSYKCNSLPAAVFDRKSGVVDGYPLWASYASAVLTLPTSLLLSIETEYGKADNSLDIKVTAQLAEDATSNLNGKLHVWLTEDSVVAEQLLPSTTDRAHVFHNIFRKSVNEMQGDDISVSQSDVTVQKFHTTLDSSWRADKMCVVAFVDNSEGVSQAVRAKILK